MLIVVERRFPRGGNRLTFRPDRWPAKLGTNSEVVELDVVILQPRDGRAVSIEGGFT